MKTKLFIAVLMITSITFAQKKNQNNTKTNSETQVLVKKADTINNQRDVPFMQFEGVKGESNNNSSKRAIGFIKLMDVKGESNKKSNVRAVNTDNKNTGNANKISEKRKIDEQLLDEKPNNLRRRVVVAKSNKQGNPYKN